MIHISFQHAWRRLWRSALFRLLGVALVGFLAIEFQQQSRPLSAQDDGRVLFLPMISLPVISLEDDAGALTLFAHNFDDNALGDYQRDEWSADWWNPTWNQGRDEDRVRIVDDSGQGGQALAIFYPQGHFGTSETGAQWRLALGQSYDELYLSYRLKFGDGFDFVRGGKLPGLVGGEANTGGDRPTGSDGWSGRMMWRPNGKLVFYIYHPDQPDVYGEDFEWVLNGETVFLETDRWYQVQHRIVMNTPGQNDGIVQGWLDGELAFEKRDFRFRDVNDFAIDQLYFSTFFGGGDDSWATTKDETIYFDDFVIRE